ncbi:MAG: Gfo/Idh/MocA family oxidoreductase [Balneolaceae bacterium]|nr:Gfo/Idh/MocA family oxidoreductase [Balneolaceae bacterium]
MKKKIALIGCGIWGQNILKELVNLDAEVHIYEPDVSLHEKLITLGAKSFQAGLPAVEDHFDGVIIATPSSTHRKILEEIAELELPIFLEKPLTINLEDALALENIPTDDIYLMHIWLYHPGIIMLQDIAKSGELGAVHGVRSTRANWTSPRKDTDSAWNLLPHDITIAKAILGEIPKPKSAVTEEHNSMIRGMTALLGDEPYAVFEVLNRYERKIREVRVHCKKGVAILEDEKVDYIKVVHGDDKSDPNELKIEKRVFEKTPPLHFEVKEFLDYLNGGDPPRSNFSDGLEVIKNIHQLLELAEHKI